jgi:hypothetical protein
MRRALAVRFWHSLYDALQRPRIAQNHFVMLLLPQCDRTITTYTLWQARILTARYEEGHHDVACPAQRVCHPTFLQACHSVRSGPP